MTVSETASVSHAGTLRLSDRVLDAIGEKEGTNPVEFDQRLFDVIDPDALNTLFRDNDGEGTVEFTYLGYRVTVEENGRVELRERQAQL